MAQERVRSRNAYALMRVLTTLCEFQQVTINGVLFLREPLTAAFAAGACLLGPGIVLVNPRERHLRGEELRDVAASLLAELDQLVGVLAMRRRRRDLAFVVVAKALHD